jgi:restriction system protein
MAAKGVAGGYVVTSGQFTAEAKEFAAGRNIVLLDGGALRGLMGGVRKADVVAREQIGPPECPKCGGAMTKRNASRGANAGKEFWRMFEISWV